MGFFYIGIYFWYPRLSPVNFSGFLYIPLSIVYDCLSVEHFSLYTFLSLTTKILWFVFLFLVFFLHLIDMNFFVYKYFMYNYKSLLSINTKYKLRRDLNATLIDCGVSI